MQSTSSIPNVGQIFTTLTHYQVITSQIDRDEWTVSQVEIFIFGIILRIYVECARDVVINPMPKWLIFWDASSCKKHCFSHFPVFESPSWPKRRCWNRGCKWQRMLKTKEIVLSQAPQHHATRILSNITLFFFFRSDSLLIWRTWHGRTWRRWPCWPEPP